MENKVKVWIARCRNGSIFAFSERPNKYECYWAFAPSMQLDNSLFPSIKWEDDEPTEAYITLAEPQSEKAQPQPKQEIDWEQRRYESAKEIMAEIYQRLNEKELRYGQILKKECVVGDAVEIADILISKLKSENR